jgi:hypothetical protein
MFKEKEKIYPFTKDGLQMMEIDNMKYKIICNRLLWSMTIILLILETIEINFMFK